MSDQTFDPKTILETYRTACAPVLKAQQEGVKVVDRVGHYQYAVAGDYLEWSLAQAKLALGAQTPADFFSKQVELTTALSEKLRARAQEFATLAIETQTSFADALKETSTKVADAMKETTAKATDAMKDTTVKATEVMKETSAKAAEEAKRFEEPKKKVG